MLTVEDGMVAIAEVDPTGTVEVDTTAGEEATMAGAAGIGATPVTGGDSVLALTGDPIGRDTRILTGIALGGIPTITLIMRLAAIHTLTTGMMTLRRQILDRSLATTLR